MGRKTETRVIGGLDVTVTQFDAMRSLGLTARLGKILVPALIAAEGVSMQDDVRALAPALAELFSNLDPAGAQDLARQLTAGTAVVKEGKQFSLGSDDAINLAFDGDLRTLLEVMKFSLEVNFGDFFSGAPAVADEPGAEIKSGASASTSPRKLSLRGRPGGFGSKEKSA